LPDTEYQSLKFSLLWQAVGWLLVTAVVILALMPHPPEPPLVNWDKSQHLLAFGVLMFWFRMAFSGGALWPAFMVALGIILEVLQGWSGYRDFEYPDMLADALGVAMGLLLAATPLSTLLIHLDRRLAVWTGR
jgi:hypothetical protein